MNAELPETMRRVLLIFVFVISLFFVLTYLISMGLGILVFFSTSEGLNFSQNSLLLYPLLVKDLEITVNAGLYFIFLWWIFAFCFAAAWKNRESLSMKIRDFISGRTKQDFFRNNLVAMPAITSMLLVVIRVLDYLQRQGGIQTGGLDLSDPFFDFLLVSQAPLTEEIIFRIVPIGTFLAMYVFLAGKRTKPELSSAKRLKACILAALQPDKAKKEMGLKTIQEDGLRGGVIWAEWVIVLLTATLFGVAHYFGGWGPGKISEAAISGAVFGLAYLVYGIQAPILLHWFFNYYFSVFDLSLDYLAEINFLYLSWSASNIFGMLLWIAFIILGITATSRALMRKDRAPLSIAEQSF